MWGTSRVIGAAAGAASAPIACRSQRETPHDRVLSRTFALRGKLGGRWGDRRLGYKTWPWPVLAVEVESSGRCLRPKNRGPDQRAPVIFRATPSATYARVRYRISASKAVGVLLVRGVGKDCNGPPARSEEHT